MPTQKTLREIIEKILDELCHNTMGNPPYRIKEAANQILQVIEKERNAKIVDIEDCTILGYSWTELKEIMNFAKSRGFKPASPKYEKR